MGFEQLGKKLAQLGQDTKSGVQKMGESYQVNTKLANEKKALHKLYATLGREIYKKYEQAPPEGVEEEFAAIKEAQERVDQLTEQLGKLKNVVYCSECGKEASRGERFCSECGARLPESEEDMKEKMKRDAREAAEEAGVILDDFAGKTRNFVGGMADKADAFAKGVASRVNKNKGEEDIVDVPWEEKTEEAAEEAGKAAEGEEAEPVEAAEEAVESEEAEPAEENAEAVEGEAAEPAEETPEAVESEEAEPVEETPEAAEAEAAEPVEETPEAVEAEAAEEAEKAVEGEAAETPEEPETAQNV